MIPPKHPAGRAADRQEVLRTMKILHCCLANFYVDGYGYQENILPRAHKLQGHEVAILASTETYVDNKKLGYVEPRSYVTEDGIPITRLAYAGGLPRRLAAKLRFYSGLPEALDRFSPDVIFMHDCQFLGIHHVVKYAECHPDVRIYVDCHTDFYNSARGWISKHLLHGIVYKYCVKRIEPYVNKFYGVLPARVDFLLEMYDVPAEKTELLVLGADDELIAWDRADEIRRSVRQDVGVTENDLLVLCGGKIDRRKNIHVLMRAVDRIARPDVKLIVFGTPDEDMAEEYEQLSQSERVHAIGWIEPAAVYDYLLASDLAVFPGTHSVLWEQAVGTGCPCAFRRWEGIEHLDVGGNCRFLEKGDEEEVERLILEVLENPSRLAAMKRVAMERGVPEFSYSDIARRAIES